MTRQLESWATPFRRVHFASFIIASCDMALPASISFMSAADIFVPPFIFVGRRLIVRSHRVLGEREHRGTDADFFSGHRLPDSLDLC